MFAPNADPRVDALAKLVGMTDLSNDGFERLTRLATAHFGLPVAAILLTEQHHEWFKTRIGREFGAICPPGSVSANVAATQIPVSIEDLNAHDIYKNSPLCKAGVRSYLGAPLIDRQGRGIGTFCVLGFEPRMATQKELAAITDFARIVMEYAEMQVTLDRIDPLSGWPNRNQFHDDVEDLAKNHPGCERTAVLVEIAESDEMDQAASVMGSSYFDDIVIAAADTIRTLVGDGRLIYRVASTHFVFLAPAEMNEADYAILLRERTRVTDEALTTRYLLSPHVGVVRFGLGAMQPEEILRRALAALRSARTLGQMVQFYSSADDEANSRRYWILNEFKKAIALKQLHLVYQPRVDLVSGKMLGVEALARWVHPEAGPIAPSEFVPVIERTTHMRSLTDWVVDEALRQLSKWNAVGLPLQMSINISPVDVGHVEFLPMLKKVLCRYSLPANLVELELTEGTVMQQAGMTLTRLNALSALGFKLAIDDFGTGYSSLSYLQKLPVDVVKIDRSFLLEVATNAKAKTLLLAMITLCQDLGYRVVAEGIEDPQTRDLLRDAGCDEAQGYYFGKPMSPYEIESWMAKSKPMVA